MEQQQTRLSLDVETAYPDAPVVGTISVGGKLEVGVELQIDDDVTVQIANADGEIIASGTAVVEKIPTIGHRPKNGIPWNERAHKAKIEVEE